MHVGKNEINVRPADLGGPDADAVSRLVEAYLLQTEREKATDGGEAASDLAEHYRREVEDPARAYENGDVYLAELGGEAVGVAVVVQNEATSFEIKRVWVDPSARGHRIGSTLLDAAVEGRDRPVRLTVWDWRAGAVRLYQSRGFIRVDSWDDRPGLICMELAPRRARPED